MNNFSISVHVYLKMRKKFYLIVLLVFITALCGCEKRNSFKYEFDDFFGYYYTDESFEVNKDKLNWLWYKLLNNDLVTIYSQKSTWDELAFKESIVIAKKTSDNSLETFAKENLENVDIWWVKFSRWKNITFDCHDNKLNLLYFQWKYSLNQYNIYVSQWFIKVDNEIYIISFATLNERNRNDFSSAFEDMQCK